MAEKTNIPWCDHTWNPWRGCAEVSPGCENCYAREQAKRNPRTLGVWGPYGMRAMAAESSWHQVALWNEKAKQAGVIRRVFLGSMMDFFEDYQGAVTLSSGYPMWCDPPKPNGSVLTRLDDLRKRAFGVIDRCQNLDFLIVTKRPENIRRMWVPRGVEEYLPVPSVFHCGDYAGVRRRNVWLLASVENQEQAERRIPELLECRDLSPLLGLSCEPLLGPLDLSWWLFPECDGLEEDCESGRCNCEPPSLLDWVIVGGESGRNARPCDVEWIRSLVGQCKAAETACFVKQLGANIVDHEATAAYGCAKEKCWPISVSSVGHKILLRHPKGANQTEWPEDLRVRQFPDVIR